MSIKVISIDSTYEPQIGRECVICGENFSIHDYHEVRTICPECCSRLNKILYPEDKEDNNE